MEFIAGNWWAEASETELLIRFRSGTFGRITLQDNGLVYVGSNIGKCRLDVKQAIDIWMREVSKSNKLPRIWSHTDFTMQSGRLHHAQ